MQSASSTEEAFDMKEDVDGQERHKVHEEKVIPYVWLPKPLHLRSNVLQGS